MVPEVHTTVSEVGGEPMDPLATASNIHFNTFKNREDAADRGRAVSITHPLPAAE
jgi:hypothetical protein